MFSCLVFSCGKLADNLGVRFSKTHRFYTQSSDCVLYLVYKTGSLYQLYPYFLHKSPTTKKPVFTSVINYLLLTIHTTYKDNNKLIKPTLLLGGCV